MSDVVDGGSSFDAPAPTAPADVPVIDASPVSSEATTTDSVPTTPSQAETPAAPAAPEPLTHQAEIPAPIIVTDTGIKSRLSQALEALRFRKRAKLDKILALAAKKGKIKNDDVEKLLHVSDATATNYLSQLVREGKLKKSGIRAGTIYEPV